MSFVAFLIPFAFIADSALLFQGPIVNVIIASFGLFIPTGLWAVGITGYFRRDLDLARPHAADDLRRGGHHRADRRDAVVDSATASAWSSSR